MFKQDPTYVNDKILAAYVREIVKRRTVAGSGCEFGVTMEKILEEISFIFNSQYGQCPFTLYDIAKALTTKENGKSVFSCFINFDKKTLWRLNKDTNHPQIFFDPLKKEVKEKPKALTVSIDYESMNKTEEELENEVEDLRAKQRKLEKINNELRASLRLLSDPIFLETTINQMNTTKFTIHDTNELLTSKFNSTLEEIEDALK